MRLIRRIQRSFRSSVMIPFWRQQDGIYQQHPAHGIRYAGCDEGCDEAPHAVPSDKVGPMPDRFQQFRNIFGDESPVRKRVGSKAPAMTSQIRCNDVRSDR